MKYPTYKLGEICKIVYGKGLPTKNLKTKGFPVFGANGIIGYYDSFLYEEEQVLISCRGAYSGKINISPKQCFITNNSLVITPKEENKVNKKYLYYTLQATNKTKLVTGTAQPQVTINNAEDLQIPLPPLTTQHAIVTRIETLFAELDKAVQHLRTAQQQLKTYKQAVLNHWLTNGSEKWQHTTIGNIVEKVEYGSSAKSEKEGKVPVLRMGNIQKGRFDWSDLVYSNDDEEISKYLLKKDDVLFNRTNSPELVGKTAIYKGERPAIFAGYLIRLHYKKDLINADFLNYYLNSDIARNYGNTVKSDGVNQSNINGQKLKTYPLYLPPLAEQQRIVAEIESRLSQATASETYIENALQQAEALRQSILKKAFSGELLASTSSATNDASPTTNEAVPEPVEGTVAEAMKGTTVASTGSATKLRNKDL